MGQHALALGEGMAEPLDPFEAMLNRLWQREGPYSDHEYDRGGRTIWGVSERAFPELWAHGPPSRAAATDLYRRVFYDGPQLPLLSDPYLREQVFDFGVNAHPRTAIRTLQQLVGAQADGVLGPETLAKVAAYPPQPFYGTLLPGPVALNLDYEAARVGYYARLAQRTPSQLVFLQGWLTRAFSLREVYTDGQSTD